MTASEKNLAASVIVPHYNQPDLLALCLESLEAQSFPRARFEIIVADNASPGGLGDLPERFPNVRFLVETVRGAAAARNAALCVAAGAAIAFTDSDCIVHCDWLEEGLRALEGRDMVGGRVELTVGDEHALSPVEAFEKVFAFRQAHYIRDKHFAVTANLFVAGDVARAIGPFKRGVAEDVEYCQRARALGFHLVFEDKAVVSHPARRDWSELVHKWDRIVRERWISDGGRSPRRLLGWTALTAATALSAIPHLTRVAFSAQLPDPAARLKAAGVLARIRLWRAWRMLGFLVRPHNVAGQR